MEQLCGGDRGQPGVTQGPMAEAQASPTECDYTGLSPGVFPDTAGERGGRAGVSSGTSVAHPSRSELS